MTKPEYGERREVKALWTALSPEPISNPWIPTVMPPQGAIPITVDLEGSEISVWVPPEGKRAYRQRLKELARREKRRAANAGNAANTSQLIGGGIGGALATSGLIALATAAGPLTFAAIVATGAGSLIAGVGLMMGHWMNSKKFSHEERMDRYSELAEEMK